MQTLYKSFVTSVWNFYQNKTENTLVLIFLLNFVECKPKIKALVISIELLENTI